VIHTGDVTVDGAVVEADLSYCAGLLNELGSAGARCPATMMSATPGMSASRQRPSGWRCGGVIWGPTAGSRMSAAR
jgi:hypothetical protein